MSNKQTRSPRSRPAVSFQQLCALSRHYLETHPGEIGVDLTDGIKTRLVHLGFQDPTTERVYQALDAIQHAHPHLLTYARPSAPRRPPSSSAAARSPPSARTPDGTFASLHELATRLGLRARSK